MREWSKGQGYVWEGCKKNVIKMLDKLGSVGGMGEGGGGGIGEGLVSVWKRGGVQLCM